MQCAEFGRVFDDCGANTKIEQPKITSQSEHQDPHTESHVSKTMEYEGGQEKTHERVNRKAQPRRCNVLDGQAGNAHEISGSLAV
jgi:hypothetical protein